MREELHQGTGVGELDGFRNPAETACQGLRQKREIISPVGTAATGKIYSLNREEKQYPSFVFPSAFQSSTTPSYGTNLSGSKLSRVSGNVICRGQPSRM
jgi:hypothetical protein